MQELKTVFDNYLETKKELDGKAIKADRPDLTSLLSSIPTYFKNILTQQQRAKDFCVEGSYGQGNIAGVPWVGIFNRQVTTTAQEGYYIVLLFSEDMSYCYLSLNQGVTAFEKIYTQKIAHQKIKEGAQFALRFINPEAGTISGPIELQATRHLGKGYEKGSIISYKYDRNALPDSTKLESDFLQLLNHYDALIPIAGKSLQDLVPVSENQYQQAVQEKTKSEKRAKKAPEPFTEKDGPQPPPPKSTALGSGGYQRDPKIAAHALTLADFKCEIDPNHKTFTSGAKGHQYVEAHHLIPMSQQGSFSVSLDVSANIVALCPNCHKLLHHGTAEEKRPHLKALLKPRQDRLQEKNIQIEAKDLAKIYKDELLEDEA